MAGKTYHLDVIGDPDTETFTVQCKELPGAIEQGDTAGEAVANGIDAIRSVRAFMARRQKHTGGAGRVKAG